MTTTQPEPAGVVPTAPQASAAGRPTRTPIGSASRILLVAAGLFVLLSLIATVTDSPDLTSSGTFGASLRLAVPIGLAGLGGLWAERAGVVNIGLEGMMILGTWFGAWAGWKYGVWWGVPAAVLGGAAGGLVHAIATVTFGVDHIVSGVAINILGGGVTRYLGSLVFTADTGGSASLSPGVRGRIGTFTMPFLSGGDLFGWQTPDILGRIERWDWVVLSDVAGLGRGLTRDVSYLTLIAIALVPITWYLLWRTAFGLRLRSVGENPTAADSLGVPVYRFKYIAVVVSGALAGLGGAVLSIEAARVYREGQVAGRGFIGLAALIFGNWRPGGLAAGSAFFGFTDALQLRDPGSVHALLLFVAVAAGLLALVAARRGVLLRSGIIFVVGMLFLVWFLVQDSVPAQFVAITPYVATLLVLGVFSQRLRPPAADGVRWRKGEHT